MIRALELVGFLGASALIHIGILTLPQETSGSSGQGAGGDDGLTVTAAPESLSTLAERWTQAPSVRQTAPPITAPQQLQSTPRISPESAVSSPTLPQAPTAPLVEPAPMPDMANLPPMPELTPRIAPPSPPRPTPPAIAPSPDTPIRPSMPPPALRLPPTEAAPQPVTNPPAPPNSDLATDRSQRPQERPDRTASAPATPQTQRTAEGASGGSNRGSEATAPEPFLGSALAAAEQANLMERWATRIRNRIARARPRIPGIGRAVVLLDIGRDGRVTNAQISQSSGNSAIDAAALEAIQRAGRFPAAPDNLSGERFRMNQGIVFE